MRASRKIGIGIAVVAALIVGAIAVLPWVIDPNRYRDRIVRQAEKTLNGRKVELGRIQLSLWTGLALRVDKFVVWNREGFSDDIPLLEVDRFELKLSVWSLLTDTIRVKRILLQQPRISLERNQQGELSIGDLLQPAEPAPAEKPPEKKEEETPTPGKKFLVQSIRIEQGRLIFDDQKSPTGEFVSTQIDQLNLTVRNLSLDQPLEFLLSAAVRSDQPNLELKGRFGPIGEDYRLARARTEAQLTLLSFPITFPQPYYLSALPVEIASGKLNCELKVSGEVQGKLGLEGTVGLQELAYIDKEHKEPPSPKFDLRLEEKAWYDQTQGAFALEPGSKLILGPVALSISGRGEDLSGAQKLEFQAQTEKFDLSRLLALFPALEKSFSESGYRLGGRGRLELALSGDKTSRQIKLLVDLTDASLEMPELLQKAVGEPLSLQADARLTETSYLLDSLRLILGELQLSAQGKIGAGEKMPAEISIESNLVAFAGLQKNLVALKGMNPGGTLQLSAVVLGPLAQTEQLEVRLNGLQYKSEHSDALLTAAVKNLDAPRITFSLSSHTLNLDQLLPPEPQPAAGAEKKRPSPTPAAKPPAEEESSLAKLLVDGSLNLKKVVYSGLSVTNVAMKLGLHQGVLASPGLSGGVAGGSFNVPFRVDLAAKDPAFSLEPSLTEVDLNQVLSAFTQLKDSIHGRVTGKVAVSGVGTEWERMNPTLTGKGRLEIQDGSLKGFDLFGGLLGEWARSEAVRKHAQAGMGKAEYAALSETKFTRISGDLEIRNGQVLVPNAVMAVAQGQVEAKGKFGFDYQTDFQGRLAITEAETKRIVKNAGIGPEVQALLLDEGKLVLPFRLKGAYPKLQVMLDAGEYGQVIEKNLKKAATKAVQEGAKKLLEGQDLKKMKWEDLFKP